MYFTIRSYMEKFQKKGKGNAYFEKRERTPLPIPFMCHRMLRLFLKKGVKIVKGTKTNKKKMPATITLFQLIRPSNAKKKGVYSAYNGEKNIHFVGKGGVSIDMKYMKYGIAFDVAHNDGVTIEKINFKM